MSATTPARFALPDGWNYGDLRQFLESELQEDFGSDYNWIWLRDFTDTDVYYTAGDGDLIQRPYTIVGGDVQWGQPTDVVARTVYQPVASMAAYPIATFTATDDGYVLRTGKIFEAGEYADKGFAITPEEMAAAAADFRPVPNNIEHRPSVLDGKLGELRTVEARGKDLFGTIAIPKWLHDIIGAKPLKVSLEWLRATKRIDGNALVLDPRVPDAALMAAFSAAAGVAPFAGKRHNATDQQALNDAHDAIVKAGAECGGAEMSDGQKATIFDTFRALFTGATGSPLAGSTPAAPSAQPPVRAEETVPMSTTTPTTPAAAPADPEKAAMAAEIAELRRKDIERDAATFAQAAFTAAKVTPAMLPITEALFAQLIADDRKESAVVTFAAADGKESQVSRVDALKALFAAAPAHQFTVEQVPHPTLYVLPTGGEQQPDAVRAAADGATEWAKRQNGTQG